jgi:hypothetical protein
MSDDGEHAKATGISSSDSGEIRPVMHQIHDQPPDPASSSGKVSSRNDGNSLPGVYGHTSDGSSGPPSCRDSLDLQSRHSGMDYDSEVGEATTRSKGPTTLHGEEDPVIDTDSTDGAPRESADNAMDDSSLGIPSPRAAEPV